MKNLYKAFVVFQAIGNATTPKIPPWTMTNFAPTTAATTKPHEYKPNEYSSTKSTMTNKSESAITAAPAAAAVVKQQLRPPRSTIPQIAPPTSQNHRFCHHTSITPSFVTTTEQNSSRSTMITLFIVHTTKSNRKERSESLFHLTEKVIPTSLPNIHQYL